MDGTIARKILIYFNKKYHGEFKKMYDALANKEPSPKSLNSISDKVESTMNSIGYKTITILDSEYPEFLKRTSQPPMVIYASGDLELLNERGIGIYGDDEKFDETEPKEDSIFIYMGSEEIEIVDYKTGKKLFIRVSMGELVSDLELIKLFCAYCNLIVLYEIEDDSSYDVQRLIYNAVNYGVDIKTTVIKSEKLFKLLCRDIAYTNVKELKEEMEGDYEI